MLPACALTLTNISIANRDDHLLNHGFIWQSTGWRLAPAFDVNPNTAKREHGLDVGAPYADTEGALSAAFAPPCLLPAD